MAFTRPKAAQIDFDVTNISDPLLRLNSGQSGTADKDVGIVIERGSDTNVALIYDESADEFVLVNTTEDGTTSGNVTISSYADLQVATINIATLEIGGTAVTSTAAELNILDGVTATAAELNILDGVTATTAELNYTDGVTSAIQTQLDAKLALAGGTMTGNIVMPSNGTIGLSGSGTFINFDETSTTYTGTDMSIGSNQSVHVLVDMNADGASVGGFTVRTGASTIDTSTELFKVNGSGAILADGAYDFDIASHDGTNGLKLGGTLVTSTAAELNILDGVTATTAELNYSDGVTSNIQTQLDARLALAGGTMSGAIAMGTNKITGMGDPTANQDAATKAYVDTQTSSIVTTTDIAGDTGTDTVTLGSDTLTFSGTANEITTAVTDNTVTISLPDDVTIGSDLTVTGNLTVNGTTTTISTTNSVVSDSLIELNTGAASNANDLGIVMERGSTGDNAIIAWDESADAFIMGTTTATGSSTGNLTITAGALSIGSLTLGGTAITSTAAELNILDGVTATTTELNLLDGVTATTAELNYTDGVTSNIQTQLDAKAPTAGPTFTGTLTYATLNDGTTALTSTVAELNILDGVTATASELNILDGVTATTAELNYSDGVTSNIQTQLDTKASLTGSETLTNKTLTSPQVNTTIDLLAQADVKFYDSDSSNYVGFQSPATVTGNILWTLPSSDGTEGQVLSTNGGGTLSWEDPGSGGSSGSSYPNSTFSTVPGTNGNFDMSYNVAQTTQETPFEASGTDAFGVNLGSVFSLMDPIGSLESIDYASGEAYVGA